MLRALNTAAVLALQQGAGASAIPALGAAWPALSRLHIFGVPRKVHTTGTEAATQTLAAQFKADPAKPTTAGFKTNDSYMLMHPVYDAAYLETVRPIHRPPVKAHEKAGYNAVQLLRRLFDLGTGYGAEMNERKWLQRMIYLESVAGVPGMVAGMLRHMASLRRMQRDHGWIHTLLEEAENERMHLLTFLKLRQPGILFRSMVLVGQGLVFNAYFLAYILSPRSCHSFVGYLEEEAIKTYTRAIEDLDAGKLPQWNNMPAPELAMKYWRLAPGATMRDVLLVVRADEACHMYVNHTFAHLDKDDDNPFSPGSVHVPHTGQ